MSIVLYYSVIVLYLADVLTNVIFAISYYVNSSRPALEEEESDKNVHHKVQNVIVGLFKCEPSESCLRFLLYWTNSCGLVKLIACCYQTYALFITAGIVYFFEFLVFEFEGNSTLLFNAQKARVVSTYSFVMCVFSGIACLWG